MGRGTVEPLRVIDETQERSPGGNLGQQAERGQGDQEAVGSIARGDAERDPQGVLLGYRKADELGEHSARRADAALLNGNSISDSTPAI